jgi:hypothetical protein
MAYDLEGVNKSLEFSFDILKRINFRAEALKGQNVYPERIG